MSMKLYTPSWFRIVLRSVRAKFKAAIAGFVERGVKVAILAYTKVGMLVKQETATFFSIIQACFMPKWRSIWSYR
ncbi:hypothetical protein BO99DRAFT_407651 [Aspergillus violaceofuscus CBS 115571]|uniref:Uncharacterized protein n=1 Tax=Aspergillus violaceofuscus (strain CBS 115571) TaxID=1450538 RepID=A0A2V5GVX8_ASPV1|nr:hypothetical protein BO99DRAFT_407651 [Aspergillus violaceofuscus CBS 115571]